MSLIDIPSAKQLQDAGTVLEDHAQADLDSLVDQVLIKLSAFLAGKKITVLIEDRKPVGNGS